MSTTRVPCPICCKGPRDTAMAVTVDDRGTVKHCFRCGYVEADNRTFHAWEVKPPAKAYRPWTDIATHLWERAQPLRGSLAEAYLNSRNCMLPPIDGDLRFLPAVGEHPAAMVARITDVVTNEPISLHFTQLDKDGAKLGRRLLAGHRKAGGCIRLWPDECVTYGLAIGEGIETCLATAHGFTPIWSTIDCGNMASFPVLPGIDCLTVIADHDPAGLDAGAQVAQCWADAGIEAVIVTPGVEGADMADLVAA